MRNSQTWTPSKFVYDKGRLVASSDITEVGIESRLVANVVANVYEVNLPKHARGRLLDLGCGKVPLYAAYRDLITDSVCVDWGNSMHKNAHVDHELDLTQPLPFSDNAFDTILLSDVLEHLPQPELLWTEMSRLLAPGGKIVMNVPFFYWLHEQPHDYYRYTEFALRRFVEISGLQLVQLEPVGGAPEVMADIFAKCSLRVPRIGRGLSIFTQWLTMRFIRTKLGRRISKATGSSIPLGYFMVAAKSPAA